ncbi:MAG: hypothetical protein H6667_14355 [Ardenticatenaceae bacterium]|nr:hypothetical protein [Ardenticatenaceae bacterium]MCB9444237.1 hypothetical protein [Ardenticatenaceae bacterium]
MKRIPTIFHLVLLIFLSCVTAVPILAQEDSGITMTAQAGFDGFYKAEFGIPVYVNVANSGTAVTGELRIELGSAAIGDRIVYTNPIDLPTQSNKRVTLYVNPVGFTNAITVQLVDGRGNLVAQAPTSTLSQLAASDLLYGVVSPEPGELEFLENVTAHRSKAAVAFLDLSDLPDVPPAWNGLDVLVLNDVDSGQFSAAQMAALQAWISTGGQLVVTGGPGWQKTAASLANWLPVTISGSESMADLPALSLKTGEPFRDPGPYLVTTSSLRRGEMLFHQDGLPLLAADRMGRGSVFFLALDPKLAPLLDWDGSERLWAEVANRVPDLPAWGSGVKDSYSAVTAVSSLPSLALPSTVMLVLFLFVYVIVIGPANYLVLKRMNRRELAWVTIPIIILVFTGLAYFTGFQIKGNDTIVNQMAVAYGQSGSDEMRVQSLIGLYSPRRSSYDMTVPGGTLTRPFEQGFSGVTGSGSIDAIQRGSDVTLTGIRVDVSGTETFIADYYGPTPDISGQASLEIVGTAVNLQATIQNNSDIPLQTVSLLMGSSIVEVGDIGPGQTAVVNETVTSATSSIYSYSGYSSPLLNQAEKILGTPNYYDDRDAFPRWQLLNAISNDPRTGLSSAVSTTPETVTLIAWSDQPQLEISLGDDPFNSYATTLYFLELPLTQNLVGSGAVTVPLSLLYWEAIDSGGGVYNPTIYDLYLSNASAAFEFQPWPDFQAMDVTALAVLLETNDTFQSIPAVQLWDWAQEDWVTQTRSNWGESKVEDYRPFIGPGNTVRIRLEDTSQYGVSIREVYPVLTGTLE